jgi:nucleotide sugar dehydrogenase
MKKITIIGLGYVGLPLLCAIAKSKKYKVFGYDINKELISKVKRRICPIEDKICKSDLKRVNYQVSNNEDILKNSNYFIICVPTPIHKDFAPNYGPVENATRIIAKHLRKNSAVILESTVNPGTCEEVVLPILEKETNLKGGKDFVLAHCPERINPGDKKWNVYNIPRNVGALTLKSGREITRFYKSFLKAQINTVGSLKVAEATKIVENTFRDVNIAFVNELAKSFDIMGINLVETLQGASTKPFAFMAHWPGCGVGGHCIAVDPYYLIKRATKSGFNHRFLKAAREVNNSMPDYTTNLLVKYLNKVKLPINGTKVALLGLSYKGNVGDLRESPSLKVLKNLKNLNAKLKIFDPHVKELSNVSTLKEAVKDVKAIVICTAHDEFKRINIKRLLSKSKVKVVIDGRNIWNAEEVNKLGIIYKGIGR